MHLHCIGLNHQTAPIHIREQFAFNDEQIIAALSRLECGGGDRLEKISEVVILSTCNRVEIYATAPSCALKDLEIFLLHERGLADADVNNFLYHLKDDAVIDHLFRVAAGLDSLVIGEPQILGQVMHAVDLARGSNTAGRILSKLFEFAIRAGKRVRTETKIGENPTSVASVAIHLASQTISDLAATKILVIGAGEMAEMAVAAMKKRGARQIRVINRTLSRAEQLVARFGGEADTLEYLPDHLSWADIVITSTGAPHTVLGPDLIQSIMDTRKNRPMVIIDIAVPRDVDPGVSSVSGVRLFDLDMLEGYLDESLDLRTQQVPMAEKIIDGFIDEYKEYLQGLDIYPLIAAMHQRAEMIRQLELEKTIGHLPDLSDVQKKHLSALTKALVKKILSAPTKQLRSAAGSPEAADYATVARALFELDETYSNIST